MMIVPKYRIYGAKFAILNWKLANNEFYETIYDFINYMENNLYRFRNKKFQFSATCGISYEIMKRYYIQQIL